MEGYYTYFTGGNSASPGKALTIGGTTWDTFHYGYDMVTVSGKKYRYISLNSGPCFYPPYDVQRCGKDSGEFAWLANELATHKKTMLGGQYVGIIVGTHFDRWQSQGCGGGSSNIAPFLQLMQGTLAGAVAKGVRGSTCNAAEGPVCATNGAGPVEINVGTGGADNGSASFGAVWSASQQRINAAGILKVTLHDATIDFDFRDTTNASRDSGTLKLHGVNGAP